MRNIGFILFCSVLLSSALAALDVSISKNSEEITSRRQKRSVIFFPAGSSDEEEEEDEPAFIGFTINPFENPLYEKQSSRPVVSHKRYVSPKKYRRRTKRSDINTSKIGKDKEKSEGGGHFIDYDGWQPLDYTDPMSNEPTFVYKPPPYERVYFGEDSPNEKPLYPVLPVNPPVYVIRAEPTKKEIHAVYGTENIAYLHVNPKTDSAKAYSAFGKNRFDTNNELDKNEPAKFEKKNSTFSLSDILKNFVRRNTNLIAANTRITDTKNLDKTYIKREQNISNTIDKGKVSNETIDIVSNIDIEDIFNSTQLPKTTPESEFSEKSLAVEDDYYYYLYDEQEDGKNTESNKTKNISTSKYDPFASIIPKFVNAHSYKEKSKYDTVDEEGDHYYAEASEHIERKTPERASLHELLKNFGGVQFDRYIFSASENNEQSFAEEKPQKPSRSRQTLPLKPPVATGRKIHSPKAEINSRDWYLIETRSDPSKSFDSIRKTKYFNNRNYFIDRQNSKYSESQNLYNPYSENHVNSLKTAESLTANSLSELLQIFKYVTTPSPIQRLSDLNAFQSNSKTFRYTKPTESPGRTKHFTTFRYTAPTSKSSDITEPTVIEDVVGLNSPTKIINDTVAETNSLDGYLFSDSEAAAEYTKPELRPNIIRLSAKQAADLAAENQKIKPGKMDKDAVQRGDIAPPLVIEAKEKDDQAYDSYLIHQGHSRVKIFGSNSNHGRNLENTTLKPKSTTLDHILMVPLSSVQYTVTIPPPTTTVSTISENRQSRTATKNVKSINTNEFQERIDLNTQVLVNKNISKWTDVEGLESPRSYLYNDNIHEKKENLRRSQIVQENSRVEKNIPSPFRAFSELFIKYFPKSSRRSSQVSNDREERSSNLRFSNQGNEDKQRKSAELATPVPFEYFLELRSNSNNKSR